MRITVAFCAMLLFIFTLVDTADAYVVRRGAAVGPYRGVGRTTACGPNGCASRTRAYGPRGVGVRRGAIRY